MPVKLVTITPDAEKIIAYCARVSNPQNQENQDFAKLLSYCAKHGHWSVFEQAYITFEIECSRTIARQILRHKSLCAQEFSQRYSDVRALSTEMLVWQMRSQDTKNRQNSVDNMQSEQAEWEADQRELWDRTLAIYSKWIDKGGAKEVCRAILPEGLQGTRMYVTGNVRSWIHFLQVRAYGGGVQKECRDVALEIAEIFKKQLPVIHTAMGWI